MKRYRVAVDIGGTFVDAVAFDTESGTTRLEKAPTTPQRPSDGVMRAITKLGIDLAEAETVVHGTTLGLNAILERKGASTGILTTEGFRDVFEIGRADIPSSHIYDYQFRKPVPLVKRRMRLGVGGRMDARGRELEPLDEADLLQKAAVLVERGAESIAVCFLHSYRDPAHEQRAVSVLRQRFPTVVISASSDITREYREYERTSTVVLEAYIRPIYERYINRLQQELHDMGFRGRFLLMRSSGGAMTADVARRSPIQTVLSGPAGGIVGARFLAQSLDRPKLLSLDFGGTSLDACMLEDGEPTVVHEASLEHLPALIPVFDIRCIGAGGGSIAWMEDDMLKVGPESAGADPGPMAYGRGGTKATATDAAVALGFLDPDAFLGGTMPLAAEASYSGIHEQLASTLRSEVAEAAAAVFDVMVVGTVGAIREITIERGHDAADYSVLAFGGAGPMLAPLLAREMGIREVIVPTSPGAFSAWGMLMADLAVDASRTEICAAEAASVDRLERPFRELEEEVTSELAVQDVEPERQRISCSLDMRYAGQEHTLDVKIEGAGTGAEGLEIDALRSRFHELHRLRYGHATEDPVEVVTVRVRGTGWMDKPALPIMDGQTDGAHARAGLEGASEREAYCFARRRFVPFRVFHRASLCAGVTIEGPAIVEEGTSTTVLHSDQVMTVDRFGHLLIRSVS